MRFVVVANSGSVPAFLVLTACHDTLSAFDILRRVSRLMGSLLMLQLRIHYQARYGLLDR